MLAASVRSLVSSCARPEQLQVHLLHAGVSEPIRGRLLDSWSDLQLATVWHDMEAVLGEMALKPSNGNYFRVYLGSVLSPEIEQVLYLDYDTLVGRDVTELWDLDMAGKVAAVVWDACGPMFDYGGVLLRSASAIGRTRSPDVGYFNAGVMFLDLKLWRERDLETQVMKLVVDHPGWSFFVIQDELNLVLQDSLLPLSPCWNLLDTLALYDHWDFSLYHGLGDPAAYFESAIVHFAGQQKPFFPLVRSSCKTAFYEVLDQTSWKGWRSPVDRSWAGRRLANLLELHWIICRGFKLKCLPYPRQRLWQLCKKDPSVLLSYLAIPVWRFLRRLRGQLTGRPQKTARR